MKKSELRQLIRESLNEISIDSLKHLNIPVYRDLDTGEACYISMLGDGTFALYDLNGTKLAHERSASEIKKSYKLKELK